MVNGQQVTIQFPVDDLKISRVERSVIDKIVNDLNSIFKTKKKELAENRGLVPDYMGLTFDYSEKQQVRFTMYDYLEDIIEEAPSDMDGEARTPVS